MGNRQTALTKRSIDTPSGRISYTEAGSGPNGAIRPRRRAEQACLASPIDGIVRYASVHCRGFAGTRDTEIDANQDVSVTANANMLREILDALKRWH